MCNSTWGELMNRLKDFLEGNAPGPDNASFFRAKQRDAQRSNQDRKREFFCRGSSRDSGTA
jgi:hypothetical protein